MALVACWVHWQPPTLLVLLAFSLSPWTGTLVVRAAFDADAARVKQALEAHAPQGVSSILNQPFRAGDHDALLDVYFLATAAYSGELLRTVVWTHGGAWVSGDKADYAPYFQVITVKGYTGVALNYSLAPAHIYPTPIQQVNAALAYLQHNAGRFHVDVDRIVLAGDSAGAQITSQIATMVTIPSYAADLGMTPALRPAQLRGVIL